MCDVVLSEEFAPLIGGAHLWLYKVYRRWPTPVRVIARDYSRRIDLAPLQDEFDKKAHGALEVQRADVTFGTWGLRFYWDYLTLSRLVAQSFQSEGPVRIHCLKALPEALALWPLRIRYGHRMKVITYAHGEEYLVARTSRELTWLTRKALRLSDLVIANSASTAGIVKGFNPEARVSVIHPGVSASDFTVTAEERRVTRAQWGWPERTVVLVMVSRMEHRKNHAAVLQAIAELRNEGLPLACVIASEGIERERLEELSRGLNLASWVLFTGRVTEAQKTRMMAAADIHIMPSIQVGPMIEGYGIVFLEAAAAGIPSIAGNVGGQHEAVIDGKTGLVVDGTRLEEIKGAIRRLALDPGLRRRMGKEGRLWAEANDWDLVTQRTFNMVNSIPQLVWPQAIKK